MEWKAIFEQYVKDEDLPFEEDLLRNHANLKAWLRYINRKNEMDDYTLLVLLYERALSYLPMSYKLWKAYIDLRKLYCSKNPSSEEYHSVNECYERALLFMHKMPRIWLDYALFLFKEQHLVTQTRRVYDRALKALPVTQHMRIWDAYLVFARECDVVETASRVYRRFFKLDPSRMDEFIDYLTEKQQHDEAAKWMSISMNRDRFTSSKGRTLYQTWVELADLVCEHPEEIKSLHVESVLRAALRRFTDQVGKFWVAMAKYYILTGNLEKARDIYEEAISTVTTVRDFSQVFEAYAEFEESVISTRIEMQQEEGGSEEDDLDIDLRMARLEKLMERRPFLVNAVLLRQDPNNVTEWLKLVELHGENVEQVIASYRAATETINPRKAHGRLQNLWIEYAKFYEAQAKKKKSDKPDLKMARLVFEEAIKVPFKHPDALAEVYIAYAEMELRYGNLDKALGISRRGVAAPIGLKQSANSVKYLDENLSPQQRLFKSVSLWTFYLDLEEATGSVDSVKAAYDRVMHLKICTPQIVINYAVFLEDNKYFEESFKVYERGIDLFGYPVAFELWNVYLDKFLKRYGGSKLERARDLFEQALQGCPPKFMKPIFLMYGKLEEEYGLAKRAMTIYDRATAQVDVADRREMYLFYIAKAVSFFGLTAARPIYERSIETLPDTEAKDMAARFIELELKLGEIDRARALFAYSSQFSDPRIDPDFWSKWHEFEVKHGNEETFKEMLRIKRSVQALNNNDVNVLSAQMRAQSTGIAPTSANFVAGGVTKDGKPVQQPEAVVEEPDQIVAANPDEIAIDYMDEDEDEEQNEPEMEVEPEVVPASVLQGAGMRIVDQEHDE